MHLKRWLPVAFLNEFLKENRMVAFPFHMGGEVFGEHAVVPDYVLRSVIVHIGDPGGGHYVCYAQDSSSRWYLYDDIRKPRQCSHDEVLGATAYMLLYESRP